MSRLPTLSTPGRLSTPGQTGIPTPTHRRPRSSLGPGSGQSASVSTPDDIMDAALRDAMRNRPPSSIKKSAEDDGDPDTPTQSAFMRSVNGSIASAGAGAGAGTDRSLVPGPGSGLSVSLAAPRTPGVRARTPAGLGVGHAPVTPSNQRSVSRASHAGRPSIGGPSSFTPRRTSMASSTTSTTPYSRRPESRASNLDLGATKWQPVVGERVRAGGMGMEGTLRYLGETEFKAGVWAGIELEGGFAGKGKNDGSVGGVEYFSCPQDCGIFVLASKLSPPTSGPSRPSSVASSVRSHTSMGLHAPSGRETPGFERPAARPASVTPGKVRTVSSAIRGAGGFKLKEAPSLSDDRPTKTLLGNSTSSNAAIAASKITAGSRASKYVGMTAKQLEATRTSSLNASVRGLNASTMTPKASRVSMGVATPARSGRPSLGGSLVTPRARPRQSNANEIMPPPPSPGKITLAMKAHQAQLEEEIRELKARNAELEVELQSFNSANPADDIGALNAQLERAKEEAVTLRQELSNAQIDSTTATDRVNEMHSNELRLKEELGEKNRELAQLQKEMKLAVERAASELDAGMEAKRAEVQEMLERAERAEREIDEQNALVEQLTDAGHAAISLYEGKLNEAESQRFELEDKIRVLEDKIRKAEEKDRAAAAEAGISSPTIHQGQTAAEIDNETLHEQIKHLQHKLSSLEEQLDEARSQLESDNDAWKSRLAKSKEAEGASKEQIKSLKAEVAQLNKDASGARGRISELEGALKENRAALEGARAEIESLRGEVAEASSMRSALEKAGETEQALTTMTESNAEMKQRLRKLENVEKDVETYSAQVATLEAEIASLRKKGSGSLTPQGLPSPVSPSRRSPNDLAPDSARKPRLSSGASDADETKMRGYNHIIKELSEENTRFRDNERDLQEEIKLLKEEVKLLEETTEVAPVGGGASSKELVEAKATISTQAQTIKELEREVSELESLIESKIYHQDDLEQRIAELEREIDRLRADRSSSHAAPDHRATSVGDRSRASSTTGSLHTAEDDTRCELCEGPHDLDACPVFAGNLDGMKVSPLASKGGKFCADCESTEHDTADCPLADDVF